MPAGDNLDDQIIKALKSLPRVTLGAEERAAQLSGITAAVSTGAVVMKEFPLYRLVLDRIKEEIAKYFILSLFVVSVLVMGAFGYLVYPQTVSKPPLEEKLAITKQSKPKKQQEHAQKTESAAPTEPAEQTETLDEQASHLPSSGQTATNAGGQQRASQTPSPQQPAQTTSPYAANQAPVCDLEILSDPPLAAGQQVKFAAAFSDPDGKIDRVKWDFGDGESFEHGPDIGFFAYTYSSPGTYVVTLTVFDDKGSSAQVSKTVTIVKENQPPEASFSDNAPKKVGKSVTFRNKSEDTDGLIVKVKWDFGDGASSRDTDPTHTYDKPGKYTVTLTVFDDQGATDSFSKVIDIFEDSEDHHYHRDKDHDYHKNHD